ncbi:hypothetical protein KIL84_004108 [Mauremys mutica]|uniref:Uncharacterized protein n=1 Tax=Mauremys mutica TaxID=74926 RepID=A0A9D3XNB2_9SAUR|nr:hypothetical protein KIL84_004108 [Mauremys mutica]
MGQRGQPCPSLRQQTGAGVSPQERLTPLLSGAWLPRGKCPKEALGPVLAGQTRLHTTPIKGNRRPVGEESMDRPPSHLRQGPGLLPANQAWEPYRQLAHQCDSGEITGSISTEGPGQPAKIKLRNLLYNLARLFMSDPGIGLEVSQGCCSRDGETLS